MCVKVAGDVMNQSSHHWYSTRICVGSGFLFDLCKLYSSSLGCCWKAFADDFKLYLNFS